MDYAAPYRGNFIESIGNLEKYLNARGDRLIYMLPSAAEKLYWVEELKNNGKIVYFIENSFFSKQILIKNILHLHLIIKKENVDFIHTNFIAHNYSLFIIRNFINHSIRIVGQFQNHYTLPHHIYSKFKIFVTKHTYDEIIAVSDSVRKSLVSNLIIPKKITTICNSLSYSRLDKHVSICLKEEENQKIIMMFGWPFYRKGVDIALNAIKTINESNNRVLLAIILSGGFDLIKKEIIQKLGFFPEWVKILEPREDIASYYNASDVFISPSREEGYTFAVLEAAYCKCLLVASKIGGNPQDIPNIELFELDNINPETKLKESIENVLNLKSDEKIRIKQDQRNYVMNNYNINQWIDKIKSVYNKFE